MVLILKIDNSVRHWLKGALAVLNKWCGVDTSVRHWLKDALVVLNKWCGVDTSVRHWLKDTLAVLNNWCGVDTSVRHWLKDALAVLNKWCGDDTSVRHRQCPFSLTGALCLALQGCEHLSWDGGGGEAALPARGSGSAAAGRLTVPAHHPLPSPLLRPLRSNSHYCTDDERKLLCRCCHHAPMLLFTACLPRLPLPLPHPR